MTRNTALQVVAIALLILVAVNAYLAISYLKRMQSTDALINESSTVQANTLGLLQDLTDMETGQRGYLLTENTAYLEPYQQAKGRIAARFASLRSSLAERGEDERSQESQLESLAGSEQGELERAIELRQKGYRRLSFNAVDTNKGKEYMDQIRSLVASLSSMEAKHSTEVEKDRDANLSSALSETIVVNLILLALATALFGLSRDQAQMLEKESAQSRETLALRDTQLEKVASALGGQARSNLSAIDANVALLSETYGGFLPKHAQECAQQIKDAAAQMEQMREDLLSVCGVDATKNAKV